MKQKRTFYQQRINSFEKQIDKLKKQNKFLSLLRFLCVVGAFARPYVIIQHDRWIIQHDRWTIMIINDHKCFKNFIPAIS